MNTAFTFNYAPHLGWMPPNDEPLFLQSAGGRDVAAQLAYAAEIGMAGVFYPWVLSEPEAVQRAFANGLSATGLRCGSLVLGDASVALSPMWTDDGARGTLDALLNEALPRARDLGAGSLVALLRTRPGAAPERQWSAAVDNLRRASDRAGMAGLTLAIEPMIALPDMLLLDIDSTLRLLEKVAHPAVQLIFDTGHMEMMAGDIIDAWDRTQHHVGPVQIADMPGRREPGSGVIDWSAFFGRLVRDGRRDVLIELEFDWLEPTLACEQAGLTALRKIDHGARTAAGSMPDA